MLSQLSDYVSLEASASFGIQNEASMVHYTYDSTWLGIEEIVPGYTAYGQFWLWEGEYGTYPTWHVVLKNIEPSGWFPVELELWHDTVCCLDSPFIQGFEDWTPTTHPWTHTLNVNSEFVLLATINLESGGYANWDSEWAAAGGPNVHYVSYQYVTGFGWQVMLDPFWGTDQSDSEVSCSASSNALQQLIEPSLHPWENTHNNGSVLLLRPSPCFGSVSVVFTLPTESVVRLMFYDIGGRLVEEIPGQFYSAGMHDVQIADMSSGVFICHLITSELSVTESLVVLD